MLFTTSLLLAAAVPCKARTVLCLFHSSAGFRVASNQDCKQSVTLHYDGNSGVGPLVVD